jgi:hypothetical protein
LASQTSAIFFQTRWDCLGSKAAIYIAPTGLRKQEEKESKWRREREREREGDHKRKGQDEGEAEKGSANSLKGFWKYLLASDSTPLLALQKKYIKIYKNSSLKIYKNHELLNSPPAIPTKIITSVQCYNCLALTFVFSPSLSLSLSLL